MAPIADLSHIVISETLSELQPQYPNITFYLQDTQQPSYQAPATIIYTHPKWQNSEYRVLLYFYYHPQLYVGVEACFNNRPPDQRYRYFSLYQAEGIVALQEFIIKHIDNLVCRSNLR